MALNFIILFVTAIAAGSLAYFIPNWQEKHFKLVLVFAGSYLFAITVIHILPELFMNSGKPNQIGLFILLGFLLQQVLELFSSGVEHGHIHHAGQLEHKSIGGVLTLMIGLFLHAFLEGTLLSHDGLLQHAHDHHHHEGHHHHGSNHLLFGILLHKGPEAFALVAVLGTALKKRLVYLLLVIFALASPMGMVLSSFLYENNFISGEGLNIFYGIVAGGFLHISTTIFFESSPDHRFHLNKVIISIIAFALAISFELFL
jgi:zinc transporter ZupT